MIEQIEKQFKIPCEFVEGEKKLSNVVKSLWNENKACVRVRNKLIGYFLA